LKNLAVWLSNDIDSMYHSSSSQLQQNLNMASTSQQQVLVRVPDELAERWAQLVAPRQRSGYLIALLRRELDKESNDLVLAAQRLNALESQDSMATQDRDEWGGADLGHYTDDGFDEATFTRDFQAAQAKLQLKRAHKKVVNNT
jgi:hypothetical protein